jgi:outer membrane protein assembly factor BamD (BamD/ComL family)
VIEGEVSAGGGNFHAAGKNTRAIRAYEMLLERFPDSKFAASARAMLNVTPP